MSKMNRKFWPVWIEKGDYIAILHNDWQGAPWYLIRDGYGFRAQVLEDWSNRKKTDSMFVKVVPQTHPPQAA